MYAPGKVISRSYGQLQLKKYYIERMLESPDLFSDELIEALENEKKGIQLMLDAVEIGLSRTKGSRPDLWRLVVLEGKTLREACKTLGYSERYLELREMELIYREIERAYYELLKEHGFPNALTRGMDGVSDIHFKDVGLTHVDE